MVGNGIENQPEPGTPRRKPEKEVLLGHSTL